MMIRNHYDIHKRQGDYDEYLPQKNPIVIMMLNHGGKLSLCCKCS